MIYYLISNIFKSIFMKMRINNQFISNSIFNFNNSIANKRENKLFDNKLERVPIQDRVSFSAGNKTHKIKEKPFSKNIQGFVDFSDKLYKMMQVEHISLDRVSKIIHSYDSDIEMEPMLELADMIPDFKIMLFFGV